MSMLCVIVLRVIKGIKPPERALDSEILFGNPAASRRGIKNKIIQKPRQNDGAIYFLACP